MHHTSQWDVLVCPQTGGQLSYNREASELWCKASALAYPVRDGVAVMLVEEARPLDAKERASLL